MPQESIDLLITGAAEVATARGSTALAGDELGTVGVLEGAAVAIRGETLLEIGPEAELVERYEAAEVLDAEGGTVLPGFVDAHTHPVFDGTREEEFVLRLQGARYAEIAAAGGGILSTVRGVRSASREQLLVLLLERLDRFLELGTTTVEAKSGYGLTTEDELKCLEVLAEAARLHPVEVVPTFLGAHDVPEEHRGAPERYVDMVVQEMLPRVAEAQLLGGARDATRGLEHVDEAGMEAMREAGVQPVLCPLVPLFLREPQEAPGRALVSRGLAPALATDFNPGSCYLQSLPEVASWAALRYGFTPAEALTAVTLNAAASLDLGARLGTLEPGKQADVVVTDLPNAQHLAYELARSPVRAVVKRGRVVHARGPRPNWR